MTSPHFIKNWRLKKSSAFELYTNSTAKKAIDFRLWNNSVTVYANANLSIYSAQECNAACGFCIEKLRPASRGLQLAQQKTIELDDIKYFSNLRAVLKALRPLNPSVSITGGEPSKDPRLPGILILLQEFNCRKRTITTNGSGLFDKYDGKSILDWLIEYNIQHLNISLAHPDLTENSRLMNLHDGLNLEALRQVTATCKNNLIRPRLSCILLKSEIDSLAKIITYLEFARSIGIDNVVFRELMKSHRVAENDYKIINFCESRRVKLTKILSELSNHNKFSFIKQVIGYYYYVEVWKYKNIDVLFEEADLRQLEKSKQKEPGIIHEMVFHPNATLCSTWQPWDGVLGPI
ncbi:radical SAM protein [Candidatus Riflebacteria bacterium]